MMQHDQNHFKFIMDVLHIPVAQEPYYIDRDNRLLPQPEKYKLFTGNTYHNRLFVHIPVQATYPDGTVVVTPIVVYQVSSDSPEFRVAAALPFGASWDSLVHRGEHLSEMDFLKLTLLLTGSTITICEESGRGCECGNWVEDHACYVSLSVYQPSAA